MDGNEVEWWTKAEAVAYSGISLRTLEREISLNKVRTKQRRQVGRRSVTTIHPADVERLRKDFTPLSTAGSSVELTRSQEEDTRLPAVRGQGDVVTALLEYLRPMVEGKPAFLSVKEAAEYSGLPEGYLRKCIKEGTLKPIVHGGYYLRVALHRL